MNYKNELYLDPFIEEKERHIVIKHEDEPCDGEITVDGENVDVKIKPLSSGAAYCFSIGNNEVIITVLLKNDVFSYDCFVNGKSLQTNMPWKIDKMDYPAKLRWEKKNELGKARYLISETLKGAIIGIVIFFILYAAKLLNIVKFNIAWYLLIIAVIPIAVLYLIISILDWNTKNTTFEKFKNYEN